MIAPHGLHNHAENSARRTCRAQERSDLSQLVVCRPQAAKAASDYKREEYLAAALSALVVTGVVASKLMANLEGKKAAAPGPARKKRKTKAK